MRWNQCIGIVSLLAVLALCGIASASQTQASSAVADLGGTTWQLVKIHDKGGATTVPDDKTKYSITFGKDGTVGVWIDCNRGRGTWKSAGPGQIEFGAMATTRAMCPPGSLFDRITKDWDNIRTYSIKDGHLHLLLKADGGDYEYEPLAK